MDEPTSPVPENDGATTPREDDDDSFHSVDEFKTPPRKTPGKKDGDNYKKRFKELQKHARELVRRHAALEAELAEARAALEVARAREVSDGGSEPYERPPRCELHAALEAERYRAAAAEDEVRRLSLALRVMKDVKNVDVARLRQRVAQQRSCQKCRTNWTPPSRRSQLSDACLIVLRRAAGTLEARGGSSPRTEIDTETCLHTL